MKKGKVSLMEPTVKITYNLSLIVKHKAGSTFVLIRQMSDTIT